jgi:hypothetical protein
MTHENWNEVKTQQEADRLMELFGDFHDSCLREAHLWTEHYVSNDLSMSCTGTLDNQIRLLIQRQFKNPAAIEMLFEEITRFNLVPTPENYDSIINSATLLVRDGTTFWSPEGDWTPDKLDRDCATWIAAKRLFWREVDWLGNALRYGPVGQAQFR